MTVGEWVNLITIVSIISGIIAAVFWLCSALVRISDYVETIVEEKGSILQIIKRQSYLSAVAAILTAISVLAQAAAAFLKLWYC